MDEQQELFPIPQGLSRRQAERLTKLSEITRGITVASLLQQVEKHAEEARIAHARNRLINVRCAEAIRDVFRNVVTSWEQIPPQGGYWLRGAMQYYVSGNDEEPDFRSPIGFEDDVEVLNACLRLAKLNELCLNVENYDDV